MSKYHIRLKKRKPTKTNDCKLAMLLHVPVLISNILSFSREPSFSSYFHSKCHKKNSKPIKRTH